MVTKRKNTKTNVRLRQSESSAGRWQVEDALPVYVQRLSNWDNTRPEEVTTYVQVVREILYFITRKFMKSLHSNFLRQDNYNTPWVRELHIGEPELIPPFPLALSVCSFLFYVSEVLGQHHYCGKFFCSSKEGMNGNRVINCYWIREGGEAGKRNISLTILLVWKLNGFWELKLDAILFFPVWECGVLDLPLERGDSVRIFLLNSAFAKLFVFVTHLSHFFVPVILLQLCMCENQNNSADFFIFYVRVHL